MVFCDFCCSLVFSNFEACNCISLCLLHKADICMLVYETYYRQQQLRGRWGANAYMLQACDSSLVSLGKKCIYSVHNFMVSGEKFGSFSRTMVWCYCTTSSFFVPSGDFPWISLGIPGTVFLGIP